MKRLLIIMSIALATLACSKDKDDVKSINAPVLPASDLTWGMDEVRAIEMMTQNGYVAISNVYYSPHKDIMWELGFSSSKLDFLRYHYIGTKTYDEIVSYWAHLIDSGVGKQYDSGMTSAKKALESEVITDNTRIKCLDGEKKTIKVTSANSVTSILVATYRPL